MYIVCFVCICKEIKFEILIASGVAEHLSTKSQLKNIVREFLVGAKLKYV